MRRGAAAAVVAILALVPAAPARALRAIPDTRDAIHVFNDQFTDGLTDAQVRFLATHEDGTQKIGPVDAARLRAVNPGFLVLHYRLGIGDGPVPYRVGRRWLTDYRRVSRHERWFFHSGGRRVFQRQWRWYLMNPDSGWRRYWTRQVLREARIGSDDGVFADSLSVPHYLGADSFSPPLRYFHGEAAWTRRVNRFIAYAARRLRGKAYFVPNAGSLVTTRDKTDYAPADGVMIEGFAQPDATSSYAPVDWELQLDRALRLVRLGRIVIGQSYLQPGDLQARGFVLASYLLVKGAHTFVNLDTGLEPEWFPEYGLALGAAAAEPPARISDLRDPGGAYVRRFAGGWAIANPSERTVSFGFDGTRYLARPRGGGPLPAGGPPPSWGVELAPVRGPLSLEPHSGAVLLDRGA